MFRNTAALSDRVGVNVVSDANVSFDATIWAARGILRWRNRWRDRWSPRCVCSYAIKLSFVSSWARCLPVSTCQLMGFYRFAASDTASEEFRPKAISYVMAGGLASAIVGPQFVKFTADAMVVPFFGTYLTVVVLNFIGSFLFPFLDIPTPDKPDQNAPRGRTRLELLKTPKIAVAIICAMVSYALMNLSMTSTPLAVVGCGFTQNDAADVVTGHVLAMFHPELFHWPSDRALWG